MRRRAPVRPRPVVLVTEAILVASGDIRERMTSSERNCLRRSPCESCTSGALLSCCNREPRRNPPVERTRSMGVQPGGFTLARQGLSRRRAVGVTAGLAAASVAAMACDPDDASPPSGVDASPADGALAANVNQNLDLLRFDALREVRATWVRGFYPVRHADDSDPAEDLDSMLTAAKSGYGTVLSLKFNYKKGLPRPGSEELSRLLERVDAVLAVALGSMSIVVIGNEPFYECSKADRNSRVINVFYERVTRHVLEYRSRVCGSACETEIYLGALTDLDDPSKRTPQVSRWLQFVKDTPALAGTDCHPHVTSIRAGQKYVDYLLPRLGSHQKFLATEFSLIKMYREHMDDRIAASYADRQGIPRSTKVWQVLRGFIREPVSEQEWMEFLNSCTWFADNSRFLSDMLERFRQTGRCSVAAYGIIQDDAMSSDFGPKSAPWILNSVFCPRTVRTRADGLPGRNTVWETQFRAAQ